MNPFVEMQCRNMLSVLKTFQDSCALAAKQDDGVVDRREAADLKAINAAADRFAGELRRILGDGEEPGTEQPNRRKRHGLF